MEKNNLSRRSFLGKSVTTAGIAAFGTLGIPKSVFAGQSAREKLPREIWIACVSQEGLLADSSEMMIKKILEMLQEAEVYQPDIVCLPECFAHSNTDKKYSLNEKVELSLSAMEIFSGFSKKHNCYTICPVYTTENGKIYNSAVFYDRKGNRMGEYRKIHPTEGEIKSGITPGPIQPPVFKTDFGIIGAQICFDVLYDDGWKNLRAQGAEIVFYPSAFAAGQMVNARAWQNKYIVVSSTRKNTSKICDVGGDVVQSTGYWNKNIVCAPVNLEKAFLHLWPFIERFPEIRNKYGRKVEIKIFHEEEWAVIESLSPDIFVKDILKEFELKTHEEFTWNAEKAQNKARGNI